MNRQFETWLRSGETNLLSLRLERESYIFLRLPKRPGFDYLFAQRQYRGDGALHAEGIEYAGIYNAADGLVYDADYALIHAEGLDDTLAERSKGNLLKRLKQDVRALVERRVAGDRGNLAICELTDARSLERLEQYRKYRAPSAARELILGGLTPEDAGFSCHYRPDQWTEDTLLDYLADPLGYAEREAARFWADDGNQAEMLLDFLAHDALAAEYEKLAEDAENPAHIIRRIMEAVAFTDAKTVTVTIHKDGQDFTFKTEASVLRRDCTNTYGTWYIVAADRREFERRFGRSAEYAPGEIVRITYARKVLYEAQN